MIFEVTDLPKGYPNFQYFPPKPQLIDVRRAGTFEFEAVRIDSQKPLQLKVGDCVKFQSRADMPVVFKHFAKETSGHQSYAIIRETETPAPREEVVAVRKPAITYVGRA